MIRRSTRRAALGVAAACAWLTSGDALAQAAPPAPAWPPPAPAWPPPALPAPPAPPPPPGPPPRWLVGGGIGFYSPIFGVGGIVGSWSPVAELTVERRLARGVWLQIDAVGGYGRDHLLTTAPDLREVVSESGRVGGELGPRVAFNPGQPVELSAFLLFGGVYTSSTPAQPFGPEPSTFHTGRINARAGLALDAHVAPTLVVRVATSLATVGWAFGDGPSPTTTPVVSRGFSAGAQLSPGFSLLVAL